VRISIALILDNLTFYASDFFTWKRWRRHAEDIRLRKAEAKLEDEGVERKSIATSPVECRRLLWSSWVSGCDATTCQYVTLSPTTTHMQKDNLILIEISLKN
jgi:hypothetical protein